MKNQIEALKQELLQQITNSTTTQELDAIRTQALGKKGCFTEILKQLGTLSADERPLIGKLANDTKDELLTVLDTRLAALSSAELSQRLAAETDDFSLPFRGIRRGTRHPINLVIDELVAILGRLGFSVATGPDIEDEFHNFTALNIPDDHPARDMQDTFWLKNGQLLRTHTSPVQVRVMETQAPPIKIIVPGKVYRCDSDVSHSPMFHQIEGLYVDHKVTFSDLKGTIEFFVHELFGSGIKVRFRPSFFPFTEPSAEMDISCVICSGKGCPVCKHSGWLEIGGCGMVNRNVFRHVKLDPDVYTGFAFGFGIERMAILKYAITDIRLFFENDYRFLKQFHH